MIQFYWVSLILTLIVSPTIQHLESPCPSVFSYENAESDHDRWFGTVLLSTEESLVGVRLDVKLSKPVQLLVSWLGDVSTEDNERFTILSLSQKLHPGPPLSSRFMVKLNTTQGSSQVRTIRLNGRQICPPDPSFLTDSQDSQAINFFKQNSTSEKTTRRPDPDFEGNRGPNNEAPVTETNRKITTHYAIPKQNQPKEKNNFYHENTVSEATTAKNFNHRDHPRFPDSNNDNDLNNDELKYTKLSSTERYRPGSGNFSQEKSSKPKPTINYDMFSSTERNVGLGLNKPAYNDRESSLPATTSKQYNTSHNIMNSSSHQQSKAGIGSREVYLSTNYQINNGQSNRFPTSANNKNDNVLSKGSISSNGKTTKPSDIESSTTKYKTSGTQTGSKLMNCGLVEIPPAPLITNGQNTARGQWPWHIALYKIEGINLSYICGGSLISPTAVVTAAHCVTKGPRGKPVDSDVLVVYLGKYHLYQFSDDGGVQNKQVQDVNVHPNYNHTNFHDDIAVLTLTSPVEYTTYVRSVCLWDSDNTDLSAVEGKEGTVVGWGYDENDQVTEELKMAQMPIVSQQTCIWSYPQFFSQFTSNKTFCAGFRKGTSVCNGDSGGGMVFAKKNIWFLRGLVSITVARQGLRVCDTTHYVVFTDVAKYLSWIKQYIT